MEILTAFAGQIIGTSLSIEMWIAVAAVVFNARSAKHFLIALVIAAAILIAVRYAVIPHYSVAAILPAVAALALWSLIGWGLRVALIKDRPSTQAVPD